MRVLTFAQTKDHYYSLLRSTLSLHREGRGWRAAWGEAKWILERWATRGEG